MVIGFGLIENVPNEKISFPYLNNVKKDNFIQKIFRRDNELFQDYVCTILPKETLSYYATNKESVEQILEEAKKYVGGRTPMFTALKILNQVIFTNTQDGKYDNVINVFISDGEPTDNCPNDCMRMANSIKSKGALFVSLLIGEEGICNERRLYSTPQNNWSEFVNVMFNISSNIPHEEKYQFEDILSNEMNWELDEDYRLFLQFNSEVVLNEFMDSGIFKILIEKEYKS